MTKKRIVKMAGLAVVAFFSCSALAQAPPNDPKVLFEAAMKSAAELKSLSFTENFRGEIVIGGNTEAPGATAKILLRAPSDLSCSFAVEDKEIRVVSNGKVHSLFVTGEKTYQKTENSMSRGQLMTVVAKGLFRPAGTWVANFLHNEKDVLESAEKVEQQGAQKIDGADCAGYALSYPGFDMTAWLTATDPPVLRRLDLDLAKSLKDREQAGGPTSAKVAVDITDWKPNAEAQDAQFVFTPPEGVEEYKPEPEPVLEGKPAEDFELPLLDGGSVKLSALKGKTVVLDFWATWCGPCRQAMPIVEKVTEELADKGVVLYAVNVREKAEVIRKYLETAKLHPKVALDAESKVGTAYGASSIPTIVLISPDGVVRKVFKGVSPDFENELRQALTDIAKEPGPAK